MNSSMTRALTDTWTLGGIPIPNRVVLAPLAGIGNWFVRLQAKRYGAGLVVSEMVSSFAVHYRNERTCRELLRIHPDEHPVSVQLFGHNPEVMASAAETVAAAGADLIDINMGCPVPKVCKTGAGAALLDDPDRAVALARAAARGSGLPVTVKLRTGLRPGDSSGVETARALAHDGGVAGLSIHPRHASQRHKRRARLRARRDAGRGAAGAGADLRRAAQRRPGARDAFEQTGAEGVLLARGSLGNPWLFGSCWGCATVSPTARRSSPSSTGSSRARASTWARSARRATCGSSIPGTSSAWPGAAVAKSLQAALQTAPTLEAAQELFHDAAGGLTLAQSPS